MIRENIYRTQDFNLACWLLHKKMKLTDTEGSKNDTRGCVFVFEVPEEIDFVQVIQEWNDSTADEFKSILSKVRFLRSEIYRFNNKAE